MTAESSVQLSPPVDGFEVRGLEAPATLLVSTRNSLYRLVVVDGCHVLVQGGRFFPEPTPACIEGAKVAGSPLKKGWIAVGMAMVLRVGEEFIRTSPVTATVAEASDDAHLSSPSAPSVASPPRG